MTSNKLMEDWVYTESISCSNMVNDSCVRSMFTSLNNLIKSLCHRKTKQDTFTLIGYFPIVSTNLFEL